LHIDFSKSLIERIDWACEKFKDRECFFYGDSVYTFQEIQIASCKLANQLIEYGFEKGMHGAVFSLNTPEAFIAILGIIRAGGIWVPINPRNSLQDNIALLKKFGADSLFFQDVFENEIKSLKNELAFV